MSDISHHELQEYLTFAKKIAVSAGDITLDYFSKDITVEFKKDKSPVTIADRNCEKFLTKKILAQYPEHGIIGEEFGKTNESAMYQWVLDPIDGTKSFIHHIPLYTVLIALLVNNEPRLGVIHNPPLSETVAAATGLGCTFNDRPCSVSTTGDLGEAYIQATDYADLARRHPAFTEKLLSRAYCCRTWGDAYGYLLVATGRSDVMIDPVMNLWDIAPLKTIIIEAGGMFTDFSGVGNGLGMSALASNGFLHSSILSMFDEVRG